MIRKPKVTSTRTCVLFGFCMAPTWTRLKPVFPSAHPHHHSPPPLAFCTGLGNFNCSLAIKLVFEQSGVNVTEGFVGGMDTNGNTDLFGNTFNTTTPITSSYFSAGLCPVNVHWHLGAEHLSLGEFDTHGSGPEDDYALYDCDDDHGRRLASEDCYSTTSGYNRRLSGESVRIGFQCSHYDEGNPIYTTDVSVRNLLCMYSLTFCCWLIRSYRSVALKLAALTICFAFILPGSMTGSTVLT